MLRTDDRGKKEEATYQEIAKLENQVEDLKSDRASSERENTKLQAKIRQMEAQILSIKQERDRLLNISSELKIQLNQSEKKKFMPLSSKAQTDGGYGMISDEEGKRMPSEADIENYLSRSTQQEKRRAKIGGVMSYGDCNFGVISEDKHADLT